MMGLWTFGEGGIVLPIIDIIIDFSDLKNTIYTRDRLRSDGDGLTCHVCSIPHG
jgi:hypothetical protein